MAIKTKNKRRRYIMGAAASVLTLAVLVYIGSALIAGDWREGVSRLTDAVIGGGRTEDASEYYFDTGKSRVFADLDGVGLASAGTLGIQVFDRAGAETLRDVFQMTSPAISEDGGRAIAFDIGGTKLRMFDLNRVLAEIETQSAIVTCTINKNGWFCVVTQAAGGFKSTVSVYNAKGNQVYKFDSASGYVLSAVLSQDNKAMAVLTLTSGGSKITFFNLSSDTPGESFLLDGGLIADIKYLSDGKLLAVTESALLTVTKNGVSETIFDYGGARLGGFAEDGGLIALYLLEYNVGTSGRFYALRVRDGVIADLSAQREYISMSVNNGQIAVLWDDGLALYDAELSEESAAQRIPAGNARYALVLEDGVFLGGENSAVITAPGNG